MESKQDNIELVNIDINEFEKTIYSFYLEVFPKDERKPIELIRSSYNKGYTRIIKIVSNEILVGFMTLNSIKKNGYAVLDYLAILPQYRNMGFGSNAIKLLIKNESENAGIFVEIEKVGLGKDESENKLRKRRQKFYEELGFKKLKFDLILADVVYAPYIYSNSIIEEETIISEILNIYESISGKERIKQICKIIKT